MKNIFRNGAVTGKVIIEPNDSLLDMRVTLGRPATGRT